MLIRCPSCKKVTELEHVERGRHVECSCRSRFTLDDATVVEDYSRIDEPPPEMIGEYRIDRFIGRGGMGKVYKGIHPSLEIPVAVKTLLPEFAENQTFKERFNKSAKICAKLDYPNIVRVYDFGTEKDGTLYLVMEYIAGGTLYDFLQKSGPLNPFKAAEIGVAVCSGLAAAWKNGIVHRDVKPENIMISSDGVYKLADLGLAKCEPEMAAGGLLSPKWKKNTDTLELTSLGTPEYMAPEQSLDAKSCDIRADIYSFGITLYQLLTGRLPFQTTGKTELRRMHLEEEPKVPGYYRPDLPIDLEYIVMRCIQKRKGDRYQTPEEMQDDLKAFLAGDPLPSTTGPAPLLQVNFPVVPVSVPQKRWRKTVHYAGVLALMFLLFCLVIFRSGTEETENEDTPAAAVPQDVLDRQSHWAWCVNEAEKALVRKENFVAVISNLKLYTNDSDDAVRKDANDLLKRLETARDSAVKQKMEELRKMSDVLRSQKNYRMALDIYNTAVNFRGLEEETRKFREDRMAEIRKEQEQYEKQVRDGQEYFRDSVIPHLVGRMYLTGRGFQSASEIYKAKANPDQDKEIEGLIFESDTKIPREFADSVNKRKNQKVSFDFKEEPYFSYQNDMTVTGVARAPFVEVTNPASVSPVTFTLADLTIAAQMRELERLEKQEKRSFSETAKTLWIVNSMLKTGPEVDNALINSLPAKLIKPYREYIESKKKEKLNHEFRNELLELLRRNGWNSGMPTPEELSYLDLLRSSESLDPLIQKYDGVKSGELEQYITVLRKLRHEPAVPVPAKQTAERENTL